MNLMPIYSTPLWQSEYPEFEEHKEIFLSSVKEFKEQNPTKETPRSNIAGYQSHSSLQIVEELRPLYEHICQMAYKAVADLDFIDCDIALTEAWLNVNDSRQCMNTEHIHGEVFSGVFYLQAPEGSGKLSIVNPGINRMWNGCALVSQKNQFTGESIRIEPIEGNIILFPSYIPHSISPLYTDDKKDVSFLEQRFSIQFWIKLQ